MSEGSSPPTTKFAASSSSSSARSLFRSFPTTTMFEIRFQKSLKNELIQFLSGYLGSKHINTFYPNVTGNEIVWKRKTIVLATIFDQWCAMGESKTLWHGSVFHSPPSLSRFSWYSLATVHSLVTHCTAT